MCRGATKGRVVVFEAPSDERWLARVAHALCQSAVFGDLDDDMFAGVARLTRPLTLPRGARLDEPGSVAGSIYLIAEGRLRLYREAPTGRQVTLDLLGAGDLFRFLARTAGGGLASLAEVVGGPATLYRFPGPRLLEILAASPAAQARLGARLAHVLARAYDATTELVLYDVETRLARAARAAASAHGGAIDPNSFHATDRHGRQRRWAKETRCASSIVTVAECARRVAHA